VDGKREPRRTDLTPCNIHTPKHITTTTTKKRNKVCVSYMVNIAIPDIEEKRKVVVVVVEEEEKVGEVGRCLKKKTYITSKHQISVNLFPI
jgi:hypothetical protein